MLKKIIVGSSFVVINLIIGRGVVSAINASGYYPEKWLARVMVDLIPVSENAIWIISGAIALALIMIEAWLPPTKKLICKWWRSPYTPLSDAARNLYEDLREFDNQHAQILMAESFDNEPDGVLNYFAITISTHAEIFGKRPPSTKLEKLDQAEFGRGQFAFGGDELRYYGNDAPRYIDLAVKSNELPKILDWLKTQNRFG